MADFNINSFKNADINIYGVNQSPSTIIDKSKTNNNNLPKNSLIISSMDVGGSILATDDSKNIKLLVPLIKDGYLNDNYELDPGQFIVPYDDLSKITGTNYVYLDVTGVDDSNNDSGINGTKKLYINNDNLIQKMEAIDNNISGTNASISEISDTISGLHHNINTLTEHLNSLSGSINNLPTSLSSELHSLQNDIAKLQDACSGINVKGITSENIKTIRDAFNNTSNNVSSLSTAISGLSSTVEKMNLLNEKVNTVYANSKVLQRIINKINGTGANGVVKYGDFDKTLNLPNIKNALYDYIKESMSGAFYEYVNLKQNTTGPTEDGNLDVSNKIHNSYEKISGMTTYHQKDDEYIEFDSDRYKLKLYDTVEDKYIENNVYIIQHIFK